MVSAVCCGSALARGAGQVGMDIGAGQVGMDILRRFANRSPSNRADPAAPDADPRRARMSRCVRRMQWPWRPKAVLKMRVRPLDE